MKIESLERYPHRGSGIDFASIADLQGNNFRVSVSGLFSGDDFTVKGWVSESCGQLNFSVLSNIPSDCDRFSLNMAGEYENGQVSFDLMTRYKEAGLWGRRHPDLCAPAFVSAFLGLVRENLGQYPPVWIAEFHPHSLNYAEYMTAMNGQKDDFAHRSEAVMQTWTGRQATANKYKLKNIDPTFGEYVWVKFKKS